MTTPVDHIAPNVSFYNPVDTDLMSAASQACAPLGEACTGDLIGIRVVISRHCDEIVQTNHRFLVRSETPHLPEEVDLEDIPGYRFSAEAYLLLTRMLRADLDRLASTHLLELEDSVLEKGKRLVPRYYELTIFAHAAMITDSARDATYITADELEWKNALFLERAASHHQAINRQPGTDIILSVFEFLSMGPKLREKCRYDPVLMQVQQARA